MKRYVKAGSKIKFHKKEDYGYVADNGYSIYIIYGVYGRGINNYIIRDPEGKTIDHTTSFAVAKEIIQDIADNEEL
jgi:hypothetical protein